MFFKEIIHGTQYYRAPTPLKEEWEGDLANMGKYTLDTIQIRINWRWNERLENEYDFSDVDELMRLAKKQGKKVFIKLLLECAPQYVFDKYDGTMIGPKGERMRGGSHGAFYGGWRPCFTNPKVRERAAKFVEKVAERYHASENLLAWNAWNEIRNKPGEECFCPHCRKAFGEYLKKKYKTIEALNAHYGTAEESFGSIALPSMPHGYWDIFEFKKFKGSESLYEYVSLVVQAIKKYDSVHPVMTHVGVAGALQWHLGDVCDDFRVRDAVDFLGTSVGCKSAMDTHEKRLDYMMLNDYMRAIDENYFVHEIYPGLGMFNDYDTPFDMRFKLYAALSCGAKGLFYWQYRAERIGMEGDCAGLARMDGSPREVLNEVRAFGADLKKDLQFFVGAKAPGADIAIVVDFDSQLMSEIEDSTGPLYEFGLKNDSVVYYTRAHAGMYRLLRGSGYNVDYVGSTCPERFGNYKVLYFPYHTMLKKETVNALEKFVQKGGIVIADEGFGMRQLNTWMQPYDMDCKPLITSRLIERRRTQDAQIEVGKKRASVAPYTSQYAVADAETVVKFADGTPAVQSVEYGKGKLYLFGFSVGYSYYRHTDAAFAEIVEQVLGEAHIRKYAYGVQNGVYEKRLLGEGYEIVFLFNNAEENKHFAISGEILSQGGDAEKTTDGIALKPSSVAYVIIKARA